MPFSPHNSVRRASTQGYNHGRTSPQSTQDMLAPAAPLLGLDPEVDREWASLKLKWAKKWKWWTVVLIEQRLYDAFGQFRAVRGETGAETEELNIASVPEAMQQLSYCLGRDC